MASEAKLGRRREDPEAIVGSGVSGRKKERGLGEVGPSRDRRHHLVVEALGIDHHGHRVPPEGISREDIRHAVAPLAAQGRPVVFSC